MQEMIEALDSFFKFRKSDVCFTLGTVHYNTAFLRKCVDALRNKELLAHLGQPPTYLEILGLETLKNIAGLDVARPNDNE